MANAQTTLSNNVANIYIFVLYVQEYRYKFLVSVVADVDYDYDQKNKFLFLYTKYATCKSVKRPVPYYYFNFVPLPLSYFVLYSLNEPLKESKSIHTRVHIHSIYIKLSQPGSTDKWSRIYGWMEI